MANEFRHGDVGTQLTEAEWEAVGTHIFNSQAKGDILYASSATQLTRVGIGSSGNLLMVASGIPSWTNTSTLAVTHTSGKSDGGTNFNVTVAGTGGSWQSGIYASVTQATTKSVNGYISGAEFEVIMTGAYNPSDWAPLVLNANNSTTGSQAKAAFIFLRDYGTQVVDIFARFFDATKGTTDSTKIISSVSDGFEANCLVTVKCMYGTTPIWLLATETAPA